MTTEGTDSTKRIVGFDGLRGVSIIAVILQHSSLPAGLKRSLGPLADGDWGVFTFFGLSAFLITGNLLDEIARSGRIDARAFWIKRFAKLVPSLLVFIVAVAALTDRVDTQCRVSAFAGALLFLTAFMSRQTCWYFAHTWSLSVEEFFYVGAVLYLTFFARGRLAWLATAAVFASPVLRVLNHLHVTPATTHLLPGYRSVPVFDYADVFVIGALAARAVRCKATVSQNRSRNSANDSLVTLARETPTWLVIAVDVLAFGLRDATRSVVLVALCPMVHAVLLAVLAIKLVTAWERGIAFRVLEWSALKYLGVISYSLYLWQQMFVISDTPQSLPLGFQSFPWNIGIAVLIASVNHRWLEEPLRRELRQRLLPRAQSARLPADGRS
jgi:peptidoglycan/LPS O-acetylase OafA/YrhL